MQNLRELLLSFTEEDYTSAKVNLHIHTNFSDGEAKAEQVLTSAIEKNYRLISITDHNTIDAHKNIQNKILLTGVEFDCWYKGVYIHLLGYGIDINNNELKKYFAKDKRGTEDVLPRLFANRNVKDLILAIHNAGGVAILAHPACYWAINLEHYVQSLINIGLDGLEVYYPYPRFRSVVKFHSSRAVYRIAQKYPQLIKTGGSDFHGEVF